MSKPSIFIGSSSEGLEFARSVRSLLTKDAEITMWDEGFYGPGSTFIETLVNALPRFDFAILVLTPDDLVSSRQSESVSPRDNVIFELGLFMGRIGRSRTFMLQQANANLKIPTDLSGVTMLSYEWPRTDKNSRSAVGAACDTIRDIIRDLGISDTKTQKQISDIATRQDTIEMKVRTLQLLVKGLVTEFEYEKLCELSKDGPFMVWYHEDMFKEIKRLDAIRYVQPQNGQGIENLKRHDRSDRQFDLKEYVMITEEGLEYLGLRRELVPPLSE